MTKPQIEIITHLYKRVTILPGTWDKSFIRNVYNGDFKKPVTDLQEEWLYRLLYKYRRQIPEIYEKHKTNPFCAKRPKGNYPVIPTAAAPVMVVPKIKPDNQLNINL
jgi:hypothetical protein